MPKILRKDTLIKKSAGTVCGIAVDEDGVYRIIRRMPHGEESSENN